MGLRVITQPDVEPISLAEARAHLRSDAQYDSPINSPSEADDDDLILTLITAAREWAEGFTGLTIAQKVLQYTMDAFPTGTTRSDRTIELPGAPVRFLVSVGYSGTESDGNSPETMIDADLEMLEEDYQLDLTATPPRLAPVASTWPSARTVFNAARVQYAAGYSIEGDSPYDYPLPRSIKQAMLLIIAHWYANTEDGAPVKIHEIHLGAKQILRNYRINKGMA